MPQASGAAGGYEVTTGWDQRGFRTTETIPDAVATQRPEYNDQGFLITSAAALQQKSTSAAVAQIAESSSVAKVQIHKAVNNGGTYATRFDHMSFLGAVCLAGLSLF